MMPEIDGFEVCRQLKENPATAGIPVIFLTARTDIESTVKGFELGAVDYVTKPFHRQELLARVKTHIDLQKNQRNYKENCDLFANSFAQIAQLGEDLQQKLRNPNPNITDLQEIAASIINIAKAQ